MPPADSEAELSARRALEPSRSGDGDEHLRLCQDDEAALAALFRAEYDGLYDFAERYVRTPAVAEELVQEVFLRLWRRRSLHAPTAVTRAYLYASTRNAAVQYLRHERVDLKWRATRLLLGAGERVAPAADAEVGASELGAAAERAIASLPKRCRLVFTLSRQDGLSYAEIAQTLGISVGTVEVQIGRALKALRTKLAPYLVLVLATLR